MINDNPEMMKIVTSDEFMNEFLNGFELSENDEYESPYCSVCGSCGESGCCSPDMCQSLRLDLAIKSIMIELKSNTELSFEYFINELQNRFSDGSYCDWNIQSYKDLEKECNKYYEVLKEIATNEFHSSLSIRELASKAIE